MTTHSPKASSRPSSTAPSSPKDSTPWITLSHSVGRFSPGTTTNTTIPHSDSSPQPPSITVRHPPSSNNDNRYSTKPTLITPNGSADHPKPPSHQPPLGSTHRSPTPSRPPNHNQPRYTKFPMATVSSLLTRSVGLSMAIVGSQNLTRSNHLELGIRVNNDSRMIDELIRYFLELTSYSTEPEGA